MTHPTLLERAAELQRLNQAFERVRGTAQGACPPSASAGRGAAIGPS